MNKQTDNFIGYSVFLIILMSVGLLAIPISDLIQNSYDITCPDIEIDNGYITRKEIQNGGFANPDLYIIELNNSVQYKIYYDYYHKIKIGNYVKIFINNCLNLHRLYSLEIIEV